MNDDKEKIKHLYGALSIKTVCLFAFLTLIYITNIYAVISGKTSVLFGAIFSTTICYYMYQFHHEATHGNISGKNGFLDKFIGNFSAAVIDLHFASYSRLHLQHHEHTNTSKDSLDSQFSSGIQSILRSVKTIFIKLLVCLPYGTKIAIKTKVLSRQDRIKAYKMSKQKDMVKFNRITFLLSIILAATPIGWNALFLWYIPANLSIILMQFYLDWLPHSLYIEDGTRYTEPYKNTKIIQWFGSSVIMAQQNYHLIHHLYPRVPFHKYKAAFNILHESLLANGAHIQRLPTSR
ncbi:MAG: fatty acid desaturase [Chitinophagaceae bacterium]